MKKANAIWRQRISQKAVSPGIWIVIFVCLLLGARPAWTFIHRPAHLNEIAGERSYLRIFRGQPQANNSGDRIIYGQDTTNGMGVFLYNNATGKSQLLDEPIKEVAGQDFTEHLTPLSWSPDDKSFAYYVTVHPTNGTAEGKIVVFNDETGRAEMIPCAPAGFEPTRLALFGSWLTPDSFAYRTAAQDIHLLQRQADGQWKDTVQFVPSQAPDALAFFTTISSNNVVWQWGNTLWRLDVASTNPPVKFFELSTNKPDVARLTGVSYSPETGQFLLSCAGKGKESLWRLTSDDSSSENPSRIASDQSIREAKWINGGRGYAYLDQKRSLVVQTESSAKPVTLFSRGYITAFTVSPNGKRLFILSAVTKELMPSIWQYSVGSASPQRVVSYFDRPLQFRKNITTLHKSFVSPSGRKIAITIFLPPDFNRDQHRRYPLVILSPYMGDFADAFCNCDVVCAVVNNNEFEDRDVDKWATDVEAGSQYLVENQIVDARQIFLTGVCAETGFAGDVCSRHPSFWKGMILLCPASLSKVQALAASGWRTPKVLISSGEHWEKIMSDERLLHYQEDAGKAGVRADVFVREGGWKDPMSSSARSDQMQQIMNFIFDN